MITFIFVFTGKNPSICCASECPVVNRRSFSPGNHPINVLEDVQDKLIWDVGLYQSNSVPANNDIKQSCHSLACMVAS